MTPRVRLLLWVAALAVFAAAEYAYLLAVPPWESPDEKWHVERAVYQSSTGRWPDLYRGSDRGHIRSAFYPPLYYDLAALFVQPTDASPDQFVHLNQPLGRSARQFQRAGSDDPAYLELEMSLNRLRWLAVVLGFLTACAVGWAVCRAVPDWEGAGPLAIVLLAGIPQVPFMSASANPECLANACAAAATCLVVHLWARERWTAFQGLAIGALAGCAVLSKTTAILWTGLIPLASLLRPGTPGVKRMAVETAWGAAGLVLVTSHWLFWTVSSGDLLAAECARAASGTAWGAPALGFSSLLSALGRLAATGWACIGYLAVYGTVWMYATAGLLVLVAATGARRLAAGERAHMRLAIWAALACLANLAIVLVYAYQVWSPQGRYLFLSLGPAAILLFTALEGLRQPMRTRWVGFLLAVLLAEHVAFLVGWVRPAFAP